MRTLAIETATEACSAALFDDGQHIASFHEVIGRGHAERLIPAIATLPHKGQADRILVSLGPGSFTGVRIGLAAARALGLAWKAQVLGYPTLALLAAMARCQLGDQPVWVCMNGGHGEWFVQSFTRNGLPANEAASLPPPAAVTGFRGGLVAGNRAAEFSVLASHAKPLAILPDARFALACPESLLTADLAPLYVRGPDAALPGEAVARR